VNSSCCAECCCLTRWLCCCFLSCIFVANYLYRDSQYSVGSDLLSEYDALAKQILQLYVTYKFHALINICTALRPVVTMNKPSEINLCDDVSYNYGGVPRPPEEFPVFFWHPEKPPRILSTRVAHPAVLVNVRCIAENRASASI